MIYRMQSASADYTFGQRGQNFLVNSPATVGQAILTTLKLYLGEWYLDLSLGVPWLTQVVGYNLQSVYDQVVQTAIVGVPGVQSIVSYSSSLDNATRHLTIEVEVQTIFGITTIQTLLTFAPPPKPIAPVILSDVITGLLYALGIKAGALSLTPVTTGVPINLFLADSLTGLRYMLLVRNGALESDLTLSPGLFSVPLLDPDTNNRYKLSIYNGALTTTGA